MLRRDTSRKWWSEALDRVHPADGVHEHAVAERSLAVGEVVDVERRGDRFEDEGAGDNDVGPCRLRARGPSPVRWPCGGAAGP